MKNKFLLLTAVSLFSLISCSKDDDDVVTPQVVIPIGKNINTAERVSVDRFSSTAGHLMVRTATNGLPQANAPINFDQGPFITVGLDSNGNVVRYYNFDVQPTAPAPIYVFFKTGESTPLSGQNNVINVIPGDAGYNDFWLVKKVNVPSNYVPNTLTSEAEILASGFNIETTNVAVNCPVVPFGSTAARSKTPNTQSLLTLGWYKGKAVAYFNFDEASITTANGLVPTSPIYVMFNDNNAGPSSGFRTEPGTNQTHNVVATSPGNSGYSPLWSVNVIDNMNFNTVNNLSTALAVSSTPAGANVNCPLVK